MRGIARDPKSIKVERYVRDNYSREEIREKAEKLFNLKKKRVKKIKFKC